MSRGARIRSALVFVSLGLLACNAVLGLRDIDPGPTSDDGGATDTRVPAADASDAALATEASDGAGLDAGVDSAALPEMFFSLNGAIFGGGDGGGVQITSIDGVASHPIIELDTDASYDNYQVDAVVLSGDAGDEFGIAARILPDGGGAYIFGAQYGNGGPAFIAPVMPPDWGTPSHAPGTTLTIAANTRYHVLLKARGNQLQGTIWREGTTGSHSPQVDGVSTLWSTGRGVGFYVYGTFSPVLESIRVTPL